jgi:hypothetical protein
MFGRNALHGGIAADRAMGAQRVTQRHQAGVEARPAALATPGVYAKNTQNMVGSRLAARASRTILLADGAVHLGRWIPLRMAHRIGQMHTGGKGRRYQVPGYNSSRGVYAELYR